MGAQGNLLPCVDSHLCSSMQCSSCYSETSLQIITGCKNGKVQKNILVLLIKFYVNHKDRFFKVLYLTTPAVSNS